MKAWFAFRFCQFCLTLTVAVMCQSVYACGGCYRLPYRTVLEKIEDSERAVVAHASANSAVHWEIDHVFKGTDKVGDLIEVGATITSEAPQILRWNLGDWQVMSRADSDLVQFMVGAPKIGKVNVPLTVRQHAQRLRYFLTYLEHASPDVAESAHAKVSGAPYAALKELSNELDRDQLLDWIDSHSSAINKRVALFVVLLGICGDQQDSDRIEAWIEQSVGTNEVAYLNALLTAQVELGGESAVRLIEQSYILNSKRQLGELIAAVDALRIHGGAQTTVSRDRITASFHLLLRHRPALAELVIEDFAAWKDWSIAGQLIEIHSSGRQPWNTALILKYLSACPLQEAQQYVRTVQRPNSSESS